MTARYGSWIIICWCIKFWILLSAENTNALLKDKLLQLLHKIDQEQPIDTLLLYKSAQNSCIFEPLLWSLPEKPFVVVSNGSTDYEWKYSSLTLLLCCNPQAEREQNEHTLFHLQLSRRLVYSDALSPQQICSAHFSREQNNVALLNENFLDTGTYYSCRRFRQEPLSPIFVQQQVETDEPVYRHQFRNMYGAPIITDSDQLAPRSMLFQDPKTGKTKMVGYASMLVNTFVEKLNATLQFRTEFEYGRTVFYSEMEEWTRQKQLDIATALTVSLSSQNLSSLTYPYMITSYCFMLPVPRRLAYKEIYLLIIDPPVLIIIIVLFCIYSLLLIYSEGLSWRRLNFMNILLNDKSLRGLLGQSFPLSDNPRKNMKFVLCLLFFGSLMLTTMYEAYLGSLLTRPPTEPIIRSFSDISKSRYHVLMTRKEADLMLSSVNRTAASTEPTVAKYVDDFHEFVKIRDSFNDSYIYPVTDLRWHTYAEQQNLFQEKLFYFSQDFCLNPCMLLCFPIRKTLPYRDLLEDHILNMKEFGLARHWVTRSFYNMVYLGLTPLEDLSHPHYEDEIFLDDLFWIWCFYGVSQIISCFLFLFELLFFWWQRRFHVHDRQLMLK